MGTEAIINCYKMRNVVPQELILKGLGSIRNVKEGICEWRGSGAVVRAVQNVLMERESRAFQEKEEHAGRLCWGDTQVLCKRDSGWRRRGHGGQRRGHRWPRRVCCEPRRYGKHRGGSAPPEENR